MDNLLCLNFIGYISLNKQKVNKQWIFFWVTYSLFWFQAIFQNLKMMANLYCADSVLNVCEPHTMESKSILFITNRLHYHWGAFNSFSASFLEFYSYEGFSSSDISERTKHKAFHW